VAVAGAACDAGAAAEPDTGAKKIGVIKAVRALTGLGLKADDAVMYFVFQKNMKHLSRHYIIKTKLF